MEHFMMQEEEGVMKTVDLTIKPTAYFKCRPCQLSHTISKYVDVASKHLRKAPTN